MLFSKLSLDSLEYAISRWQFMSAATMVDDESIVIFFIFNNNIYTRISNIEFHSESRAEITNL